ncbi:MAG: YggS family pyridoxal phosphate-dependent enzyme [Longimicrobiales bacterium]
MYEARLKESWPAVARRIEEARSRGGRANDVTVVAVTKTHPPAAVLAAYAAGLRMCGENRVQELVEKREEIDAQAVPGLHWHLIGHLQRNKVRQVLPLCDLIHSVDTDRLAAEISAEAVRLGRTADVLVQVNASGEETKGGFGVEGAAEAVARLGALEGLRIRGLMTMAPFTDDEQVLRGTFRATRRAFEECAAQASAFAPDYLSMGMSNDFEIAIEEGATMVRLGTILFGERQQ